MVELQEKLYRETSSKKKESFFIDNVRLQGKQSAGKGEETIKEGAESLANC
jgi:hypothetical protein